MPRSGSLEPDEVVRPASGPLLYPPRCAEAAGRTWLRSTNRRSSPGVRFPDWYVQRLERFAV